VSSPERKLFIVKTTSTSIVLNDKKRVRKINHLRTLKSRFVLSTTNNLFIYEVIKTYEGNKTISQAIDKRIE
jgi:hypothetical protein